MGVHRKVKRVARATWREVRDENIAFMAGSIAYYAFVSMLPLLLFLLFVLSAVDNQSLTAYLYSLTESVLTPHARGLLVESLNSSSARTGVSVIGAITLLWGTSRIFRGLDVAFAEIYDVEENKSFLAQFRDGLVVAVALALAVATVVAAGVVFAVLPDLPYPTVVNPLLIVVGLSIAFFPIYYVFPDVKVRPIEVIPGTVLAAIGWAVLEGAFQAYVVYAGRYEAAYGTLGSVLLLLVWLYASGFVLLVGGVVNAVLAGRTNDENALGTPENFEVDEEFEPEDASEWQEEHEEPRRQMKERRQEWEGRQEREEREGREQRDRQAFDGVRDAPVRNGGPGPTSGRTSEESSHSDEALERPSARSADEYRRLREEVERLATEVERVEAENERLRRERRRLKRNNADLARRLERRRRSVWKRAKRWAFRK